MTPPPQPEYIITYEKVMKIRQIMIVLKATEKSINRVEEFLTECPQAPTHAAPDAPKKRWEDCRQHFTCPNGEECWYLSEDYHNDEKATIRNQTLDEALHCLNHIGIKATHAQMTRALQSLHTPSTQEHERGDQR